MKQDEHDELWHLLGKARTPKERPFFAAKVLRAVENEQRQPSGGLLVSIRRRWLMTFGAFATAVIVVFFVMSPTLPLPKPEGSLPGKSTATVEVAQAATTADPLAPLVDAAVDSPDELAASLANLLATQDHSLWLQADPSSLY